MNHLLRELAPLSDAAWEAVDAEASRALRLVLAARKLLDFDGPGGWQRSAVGTGRTDAVGGAPSGASGLVRRVQPLAELRVPFTLSRAELADLDRGAPDPDLDVVLAAATRAAEAEDRAVFHGWAEAGIVGLAGASPHQPVAIPDDAERYPTAVARAVATLRQAGVEGPFGIALGPRCYTAVTETTERGGYPVIEHLKLILGGPAVWAPAVDGAFVVSMRGGDATIVVGQDWSIGYLDHDADSVFCYLEQSFTLTVAEPRAAVHLAYVS